jgi:hypothetical protein
MAPIPTALSPALPSELLTYVLSHQAFPTTVIICQPRQAFLSSLLRSIDDPPAVQLPEPSRTDTPVSRSAHVPEQSEKHPLLIPTLRQVAASRYINLVFIDTVTHLRAYLAAFPPPETENEPLEQKFDRPRGDEPLLLVYGLLALHRDTSEWSAQGLGNSVAALVEAGWRTKRRILLLEERSNSGTRPGDGGDEAQKVWEEQLPMLNGSVRRAGLEAEGGGWSGRTVEVGKILQRWFKIEKGDWDDK